MMCAITPLECVNIFYELSTETKKTFSMHIKIFVKCANGVFNKEAPPFRTHKIRWKNPWLK